MEWFNVGKIVNTHGVRGEVKVLSVTDFEEKRFAKGAVLYFEKGAEKEKVTVKDVRYHKQFLLLTLHEYTSLNDVEKWKGASIVIPETDLEELEEGEFYYHQIIGCDVYSEEGEQLGRIKEILTPGANDVWVVKPARGNKDIMIPYIDDVVKDIDIENQMVTIHVMEGLLS
ncbi:16S rRNA processing protein RimM [Alteribacillus persepolensis]|uniref:Ribosome maturation factor RimM n=2 Tax=Alteribacillus persepolensis TaxID=568899 RepID=A0A1G7YLG9_9BACI|nr:16S rRNA processing protein RimM [Alteribacillus persepolensis]